MAELLLAWHLVSAMVGMNVVPTIPHDHCWHAPNVTLAVPCPPTTRWCCWCNESHTTRPEWCSKPPEPHGLFAPADEQWWFSGSWTIVPNGNATTTIPLQNWGVPARIIDGVTGQPAK